MNYAELCVTSNFTFLKGASHPEELVARATRLGLSAIAITDRNSLAGVVRAYSALKEIARKRDEVQHPALVNQQKSGGALNASQGSLLTLPRLLVGCRLVFEDSSVDWIALPRNKDAYARLSRLLTRGKRRSEKGKCQLFFKDLMEEGEGMVLIAMPQEALSSRKVTRHIQQIAQTYPTHVFLGAVPQYDGNDQAYFDACAKLALRLATPMVALGDVLMHDVRRRQLADVLTCIREGLTIDQIGRRALPNCERRLKSASEMAGLFRTHPAAIKRTLEIANRCSFCLSELSYNYPEEGSNTETAQQRLERLTLAGIKRRYPAGETERVRQLVEKELMLVDKLGFAAYFLTVHDIVSFARSKDILCQGRGSAANSIICYALGITDVAPETISMVFERFISEHRGEPPDIDVDFEHERREEVIQHIYKKYGRHRAGLCATVIHFRSRAAIREVGKVMGLSQDLLASLSGQMWGSSDQGVPEERLKTLGLDTTNQRLVLTIRLIKEIIGFPRHLSQHVGGFIITKDRLDELCPIENAAMEDRTTIEWDKDDIDALGILKVDILSLGMLTCIRKCFALIEEKHGKRLTIDEISPGDSQTYDMLCAADAIGVFQVESRAQMNFLPRMKPRSFYDLVIEVAIVRPGPIQGGMVHPYIKRRQGKEQITYPSQELEEVLGKTLGVPLFQEQAMRIAEVAAGFTPEEADHLRRSLATFKRMGTISSFKERFIQGMLKRNYELDFAERCFAQIEGFGNYGFPESHAAAFALLAYVSAWLKCHHPAAFACALLNSQPMGFYAPAQIIRDAREHDVEVRSICVNRSHWDNTLEWRSDGELAIQLGFRQIKGFKEDDALWIAAARGNGYPDPQSIWSRAHVGPAALERLAEADGFASMGLSRREALWQVKAIKGAEPLPLFNDPVDGEVVFEPEVHLPTMHLGEEVVEDYLSTRFSLRAHPMELLRPDMPGLMTHANLQSAPLKQAKVCGLVITRQRPGTASGVIFITLEDETGVCNVVVWPKIYEKFRREVISGRLLHVVGYLQREGTVVHLIAQDIKDYSDRLSLLGHPLNEEIGQPLPGADDAPRRLANPRPTTRARHPREQAKRLFPSRDFH